MAEAYTSAGTMNGIGLLTCIDHGSQSQLQKEVNRVLFLLSYSISNTSVRKIGLRLKC